MKNLILLASLINGFYGISAQALSPCNAEMQKAGKVFHQICSDEKALEAHPRLIYSCVVEYDLDSEKWFKVAQEKSITPNQVCLRDTPLTRAIQIRSNLVPRLLALGADPNLADGYCRRPAGWAAYKGILETLKQLEGAGADLLRHDGNGGPARDESSCEPDPQWNSPLHWAARIGRHEIVSYLLAKGADKDAYGFFGGTALMMAADGSNCEACGNYPKTVEVLLNANAQLELVSREEAQSGMANTHTNGQTALFYAAFRGSLESMRLLVEKGANVNHQNGIHTSVLDGALHSSFSSQEKVKYLCEHGAKREGVCP